jgi:hypothetical protein
MIVIEVCKDLPQWGSLKFFLAPLETKSDFANFLVATEGWRPGA